MDNCYRRVWALGTAASISVARLTQNCSMRAVFLLLFLEATRGLKVFHPNGYKESLTFNFRGLETEVSPVPEILDLHKSRKSHKKEKYGIMMDAGVPLLIPNIDESGF